MIKSLNTVKAAPHSVSFDAIFTHGCIGCIAALGCTTGKYPIYISSDNCGRPATREVQLGSCPRKI